MMRNRPSLKKIKKDYQCKNLKNPFFYQKKKGRPKRILKLLWLTIPALLIFLIWFFFGSSFFRWQNIRINGLTRSPEENILLMISAQASEKKWLVFRQSNIFLFDEEDAAKKIIANYNFASLEIAKRWPRTLLIKVGERPYAFIFQQSGGQNYASADGYVIKEVIVKEEDRGKYFILENTQDNLIDERNKINLSPDYLNFVINLNNLLSPYSDLPVERYIIEPGYAAVRVKFRDGPFVFFNAKLPAEGQVDNLVLVKKEKIKDNFSKTKYIDLRYGERIFIN